MIRLFLFFMAIVMVTGGTSMAENLSTCSVDTVPIQITYGTMNNQVTTLSAAKIINFPPSFPDFVTAITKHVAVKLAQENLCLDSAESQERSLLQFAPWPITANDPPPVPLLEKESSYACRISSPWIDLVVERGPIPSVRGIVRYSERQLLVDQAVLAEVRDVTPSVAMPLKQRDFEQYANEYTESKMSIEPEEKPIEERVPPDLLWLFRRAWQGTLYFLGDAAYDFMRKAMEANAENYTKLVIALFDLSLASAGEDIHYDSILEVADLISLEEYKIVKPIR